MPDVRIPSPEADRLVERGRCPSCGYELNGTLERRVCSACGATWVRRSVETWHYVRAEREKPEIYDVGMEAGR